MSTVKVKTIKHTGIFSIQLSGSFYKEIQQVLFQLTAGQEQELTELIEKLNNEVPVSEFNEWELAVQTMMILCAEIEEKAEEQGCTEEVEVNPNTVMDSQSDTQSVS